MKKVIDAICKVEMALAVLLLAAMLVVIFVATFGRYTGLLALDWSEEFARYAMIWATFLGIGVGAAQGSHFNADILGLFCSEKVHNVFRVICAVLVIVFAVFCIVFGSKVLIWQSVAKQVTPSLHWPMWLMYLSIPLGVGLMAITYAYRTYEIITGKVSGAGEMDGVDLTATSEDEAKKVLENETAAEAAGEGAQK